MIQALVISLAVVLAFALPAFAETKPPPRKSAPILIYDHEAPQKPGRALKARQAQSRGRKSNSQLVTSQTPIAFVHRTRKPRASNRNRP